jgi:mannose-6-phosphate isomerase-like protein (cupin superfamily)
MNKRHLSEFTGGWFVGSFTPSLEAVTELEVCLKRYSSGEKEPLHHQREATEYTLVISGTCRMGNLEVGPDEIVCIPPGEAADFEALEDVVLVAIKTPSLPDDKVLGPAPGEN